MVASRTLPAALAVLSLAAGCYANFHPVDERTAYRCRVPTMGEIEEYARDPGIRTVVNVSGHRLTSEEVAACRDLGVDVVRVKLSATRLPSVERALDLCRALRTSRRPVLIYCPTGADRTSLASAVFLMLVRGVPAADARRRELTPLYGHLWGAWWDSADQFMRQFECTGGSLDVETWIRRRYLPVRNFP